MAVPYLAEEHSAHGPEVGPCADLVFVDLLQEGHVEMLEGQEHHGHQGPGSEE